MPADFVNTPFKDYICPKPDMKTADKHTSGNPLYGAPPESETQIATVKYAEVAESGKKPFMRVAGGDTSAPGEKK